jgi:hypothetical protein
MTNQVEIRLEEFAESTVTRKRGSEAAQRLIERLGTYADRQVVVQLFGREMISGSFIDEIVQKTRPVAQERNLDLVFRVSAEAILEKLRKTSGLRGIPVRYVWQDRSEFHDVEPIKPKELEIVEDDTPLEHLQAAG